MNFLNQEKTAKIAEQPINSIQNNGVIEVPNRRPLRQKILSRIRRVLNIGIVENWRTIRHQIGHPPTKVN